MVIQSQKNTEKTKEIEKEDTKQKDDIQQINKVNFVKVSGGNAIVLHKGP